MALKPLSQFNSGDRVTRPDARPVDFAFGRAGTVCKDAYRFGVLWDGESRIYEYPGICGFADAVRVVELNTLENPNPKFRDETQREQCPKCGNYFRLGYGMWCDSEVGSITRKHMELCEGDAAVTLLKIDAAFKAGWRPAPPDPETLRHGYK